ncbi:SDR family NAD(P)-dependent oxidoreductase [Methylocella sp.]|uniref:SDR family NAD(P)-dependent oxidoreductase n=1 Tax=Methylocella sp. TaxID=1978226 RepID=UPI003783ECB9
MAKPSAVVFGVGVQKGLGAASARRFAAEGYHVHVVGRSQDKLDALTQAIIQAGGSADGFAVDVTDEAQVAELFQKLYTPGLDVETPELVVYNAGSNQKIPFQELTARQFEDFWRVGCLGGFLVGQRAAAELAKLGHGTIIFTGASASLRGRPAFVHFAAAKAGLRMLSQAMAREYGPQDVHVAHVIIDGGIDGEILKQRFPDALKNAKEDGFLSIEAIADTYWSLHKQHRSAWTQELDLRPYSESF